MSLSTIGDSADCNDYEVVDGRDLFMLAEMWLADGLLLPGNINRRGSVDFSDYAELAENWLAGVQ
ncbi:MAG: hypothetical protein JSU70_11510 [Phycisphaerales bacterium]|nr:MAG: hypothetical protein JSU70_11510 [Phycisphaerales bacterium]